MKVKINSTGFKLSADTESVRETPGAVKFMEDHGVPFDRFSTEYHDRIEWHVSVSTVEIPCSTVQDLQQYCKEYNATFMVQGEHIKIDFQ